MKLRVRYNRHHDRWVLNYGEAPIGGVYFDSWNETDGAFAFKDDGDHVGYVLKSEMAVPELLAEALREKPPADDPVVVPLE